MLCYGIGLIMLGVPYALTLKTFGAPISLIRATTQYVVSHLGKYVPGKAMVIVIRCALAVPFGVPTYLAVLSSFLETFVGMASGAFVALAGIALYPPIESDPPGRRWAVIGLALFLSAGFGVAIIPRVFHFLAKTAMMPWDSSRAKELSRVPGRVVLQGLAIAIVAWMWIGAAFAMATKGVDGPTLTIEVLVLCVTSAALSIVGGFVSMIPGQLAVRELILMELLAPAMGDSKAVAASILFRLVTILVEAALGALFYLGGRR